MIKLTAKIELSGGNDFEAIESNIQGNKNLQSLLKTKIKDTKDGWVGSEYSNSIGVFEKPYLFRLKRSTNDNSTFNIDFDKTNNLHPNKIKVGNYAISQQDVGYEGQAFGWQEVQNQGLYRHELTISLPQNTFNVDFSNISISAVSGDVGNYQNIPIANYTYYIDEKFNFITLTIDTPIYYGYPTYLSISSIISMQYNYLTPYTIFVDDDPIFNIVDLKLGNFVYIEIEDWNKPNSPLVITGIYTEPSIEVDLKNQNALNRNIVDRADTMLPSYGIISNVGNIDFNDTTGNILDYANQNFLTGDMRVEFTLTNTLTKKSQLVGVFKTSEWNYDNNNRAVSVALKDDLEEWQDIFVEGINYDPRERYKVLKNGSMEDLYNWLHERTPSKYQMLTFEELDDITKEILSNTKLQYPLLEEGTLWEQWTKLCQVCGCYIYKNNKGKTTFTYTYGS